MARSAPAFFARIEGLPGGTWSGPVSSAFGRHLLRLTARDPGGMPSYEDLRGIVEQDWRSAITKELRDTRYAALRDRFTVVRPAATAVLGQ